MNCYHQNKRLDAGPNLVLIVRYHWICDVFNPKLELSKTHIEDNGSHMITKALPRGKFEACCDIIGFWLFLPHSCEGEFIKFGLPSYVEKDSNI